MNREMALDVLGLQSLPEDEEDLIDQIEEQVFPIREYFLRNPVVSILHQKRIRQLERIQAAAEALGVQADQQDQIVELPISADDLKGLLKRYEEVLMQARLQIASTMQPKVITSVVHTLLQMQEAFESRFMELTDHLDESEEIIKASEHVETGVLLLALRNDDQATAEEMIGKERKRINVLRRLKHPS